MRPRRERTSSGNTLFRTMRCLNATIARTDYVAENRPKAHPAVTVYVPYIIIRYRQATSPFTHSNPANAFMKFNAALVLFASSRMERRRLELSREIRSVIFRARKSFDVFYG